MRAVLTFRPQHPFSPDETVAWVINPITPALVRDIHKAMADDPDGVLEIPNARVHADVPGGTGFIAARRIVEIREI